MGWRSRWFVALSALLVAVGAAAAEGTGEPQPGAADIAPWLQRIRDKVQVHFSPPPDAPPGATATFEIWPLSNGQLWFMRAVRTSGSTAYELAARGAVAGAQPLPVPEEPATFERMRIVTLEFENWSVRALRAEPKRQFTGTSVTQAPFPDLQCVKTAMKADAAAHCDRVFSPKDKVSCFFLTWQQRLGQIAASCGDATYPLQAREQRLEGTTQVAVTYDEHATLQGIKVRTSSGHPVLDQRALELVRVSELDPPASLRGEKFSGRLPIIFKLRQSACASGQDPGCAAGGPGVPGPPAR